MTAQPVLFGTEATGDLLHMVLPNMSLACGRDLLEVCDAAPGRVLAFSSFDTTCPECQAQPIPELCRAQQNRQAAVTA